MRLSCLHACMMPSIARLFRVFCPLLYRQLPPKPPREARPMRQLSRGFVGREKQWRGKGAGVASALPSPLPSFSFAALAALLSGRLCSATQRLQCAL